MELKDAHVICVGAGIMSATFAVLIKELAPETTLDIFERLDHEAEESSDAWNNAGTGHSAYCELNYTPENDDGSIDVSKALKIAESFMVSRQFWGSLVGRHALASPKDFINPCNHISFVWGGGNVSYLAKRFSALGRYKIFEGMRYTEDASQMLQWMPLVMEGRKADAQPLAATCMPWGTDVNFGTLTVKLVKYMDALPGTNVYMNHQVDDIKKMPDGKWEVTVENRVNGEKNKRRADFVFIGAGGGTLPLLEKSDIPEANGFGGFPISGQWLSCTNPNVIDKHHAKVYGKAAVGSPPMSVPHLDTRIIDGEKHLLFGPYAGFSTKFLKNGSYWDLPLSIEADNILPLLGAGLRNIPLTKYLVEQVIQSDDDRLNALREYCPSAEKKDWKLIVAGQRVQVIKKDKRGKGVLEFGTEVVNSADGTIAGLLGASPGASTAVSIMIDTLKKCFPEQMAAEEWKRKLKQLIPSYGQSLLNDDGLMLHTREWTGEALAL